jgi:ABC-type uncharacterized transport system substrate-binding protein
MTLALGLAGMPHAPHAQAPGKVYRVGLLTVLDGIDPTFREALRQLGYVEGQNLVLEGRFARGEAERLPAMATELVQRGVDVLVTFSTPAALAARAATTTIPIVMASAVSANLLHGSERFILQNQEPVTRCAAALKRAAQREKRSRARQSAPSSRNSMLLC